MNIICSCLLILSGYMTQAQQSLTGVTLQEGDLLFQNLDCELCEAIEDVTEGFEGNDFSHIGLVVYKDGTQPYVIEAIGKEVQLTPLADFEKRTTHKIYVGRLDSKYQNLIPKAVRFAKEALGKPYDDAFIYDNGKYYCSELIYDAFKSANKNKPVFALEPMTFKGKGEEPYNMVWVNYYRGLGLAIPEGEPGINPAGISRSDKMEILNK